LLDRIFVGITNYPDGTVLQCNVLCGYPDAVRFLSKLPSYMESLSWQDAPPNTFHRAQLTTLMPRTADRRFEYPPARGYPETATSPPPAGDDLLPEISLESAISTYALPYLASIVTAEDLCTELSKHLTHTRSVTIAIAIWLCEQQPAAAMSLAEASLAACERRITETKSILERQHTDDFAKDVEAFRRMAASV
jgi:hypothetical protein